MVSRVGRKFDCFFFNDTATTEIYALALHDALPISDAPALHAGAGALDGGGRVAGAAPLPDRGLAAFLLLRSEEHTSELQSRQYIVCRLLLEKKTSQSSLYLYISLPASHSLYRSLAI